MHFLFTSSNNLHLASQQDVKLFFYSCTAPFISTFAIGGGKRDRTVDLRVANASLSQLSYTPITSLSGGPGRTRTSDLTLIRRAL